MTTKEVLPPEIVHTDGVCGGSARIDGTRIAVWSIMNFRRLGLSARQIVAAYPTLSLHQVKAAIRYAKACPQEIENEIRQNNKPELT